MNCEQMTADDSSRPAITNTQQGASEARVLWSEASQGRKQITNSLVSNTGTQPSTTEAKVLSKVSSTKVNAPRPHNKPSNVDKLRQGKKVNTTLKTVKKSERIYAMFVTRFAPDVSCDDIVSFVKEQKGIELKKCEKLKTKHDSYASFYIAVNESEYDVINNDELWPEGIYFTRFYGKLDPSKISNKHVESSDPPETENGTVPLE